MKHTSCIVENDGEEISERKGVEDSVAKALILALKFKDYSHWKKERNGHGNLAFILELGYNYRLMAEPPGKYLEMKTEYTLLYNGKYMYGATADSADMDETGVTFRREDHSFKINFRNGFDAEEYALSMVGHTSGKRINCMYFDKKTMPDVFWSRKKYWGIAGEADSTEFAAEFLEDVQKAALLQKYEQMEKYSDFLDKENIGPVTFYVCKWKDVSHSSDIKAIVESHEDSPIEIWMKGCISYDRDGVVIRGDYSSFTIKITDEIKKAFVERNAELLDTGKYLSEHPFRSYADIVGDKLEYIVKLSGYDKIGIDEE